MLPFQPVVVILDPAIDPWMRWDRPESVPGLLSGPTYVALYHWVTSKAKREVSNHSRLQTRKVPRQLP